MQKTLLAIAAAALAFSTTASAQSQQEALEARYDRALAAGYKALFLCSAIANAERNGATRTPESVMQWELTGIQSPLDEIVGELPYVIQRFGPELDWIAGKMMRVGVKWDETLPPRSASHRTPGGCTLHPIGTDATGILFKDSLQFEAQENIDWQAPTGQPDRRLMPDFDAYGDGTRTTATVVIEAGKLAAEQYAEPFGPNVPQRTWSVAKSIAATLVGAAVHRGEADVSASAGLGVNKSDPRHAISIDHLLRMASGRYSDTPGNRTDPLYFGGSTAEETALHWPLIHEPGSVYRYANNDTLAAIKAIEDSFKTQTPEAFFGQVGMSHTVAETDWQGDYVLSSQAWTTARDLAKFGQLYLDDGVLPSGERVLPEGWTDYVSSPSGPQPDGPFGYGAGFWLFNQQEGIPPDTFAAMGNRGQFVVIVPSRDVVIVRRGEDPAGSRFDIAAFTRDVLEALAD